MNRLSLLSLAIAASLLTLPALTPRIAAASESVTRTRPGGLARDRLVPAESRPETLAQNDQMNMQQGTPGNGEDSVDTGDQSPPDDQSVDTETGQEVPQQGFSTRDRDSDYGNADTETGQETQQQSQGPPAESGMDAGDLGETNQNVGDSGGTPQNNSGGGDSPQSSDSGY